MYSKIPLFMKKFIPFLILALVWIGWSCSSDNKEEITPTPTPEPENTKIEITSNQPVMEQTGGTATVSFTTNAAWTASVSANTSWVTVSPTSGGKGTHTLSVTTTENDTYDERNASVTIKAGNVSKNFTVTQKQKDALTVTSNKVELEAEGGDFSIEVKANVAVSYKIEEAAKEWIMESKSRGLSTTTLIFKAKNNESEETRQATIMLKGGDNLTETVTVYQAGKEKEILLLTQDEYTVESEGDTLTVELKSDTEYEMVWPDVDWVSEASSRAVSSYTHYIAVAPNETYSHRKTQIVFRSKTSETADTLTINQLEKDKEDYGNPQNDREVLEILYDAMNGDEWNDHTNWYTDKPLEEWYGVETDDEGNVIRLDLQNYYLSGYIPEEIGKLSHLEYLLMYRNSTISGTIPKSIGDLSSLISLYIAGTELTGTIPEEIGQLTQLESLLLQTNQLEGELPASISNLVNLDYVTLSSNRLEGHISVFTQFKKLTRLDIHSNKFTGPIPENIGELGNLNYVDLSGNPLSGPIPESIGNLRDLYYLDLSGCELEGSIPESIGYLNQLEEINLSQNNLSGYIPSSITNLDKLYYFYLYDNPELSGLPQYTSIMLLPCWQYVWWNMIEGTSIKAPIEEQLIPGPYFELTDLDGNTIKSIEEYKNNKYTVLVQWDTNDSHIKAFMSTLVSLYETYKDDLNVIGWYYNTSITDEERDAFIKEQNITWRNIKVEEGNYFNDRYWTYPHFMPSLTVHVINSKNRVVFSSLVSDVNTLPDFIEKALAE